MPLPEQFGAFTVEADGTLSLDGQTKFPMYGPDGGLSFKTGSYKLHEGNVIEAIIVKPKEPWVKKNA